MNTNTSCENTTTERHAAAIEEANRLQDLAAYSRECCWPDKARRFANRALAILEREHGPNHPEVAKALLALAGAREEEADHTRAESDYRRARAILDQLPHEPGNLAVQRLRVRAACGLATVLCALGRYREAESTLKNALNVAEQTFGWKHDEAANVLNEMAALYREVGGFEKAFRLHQRALEIAEGALGPEHPTMAAILQNLAVLEHRRDRLASAEAFARQALAIREKTVGHHHPYAASSASVLAGILHSQGKFDDAATLYGRALTIFERWFGPDHHEVAATLSRLSDLFRAWGRETRHVDPPILVLPNAPFPSGTGVAVGLVQPGALYHH